MVFEALFSDNSPQSKAAVQYMASLDPNDADAADNLASANDAMEEANGWDHYERGVSIAEKLNIGSNYMSVFKSNAPSMPSSMWFIKNTPTSHSPSFVVMTRVPLCLEGTGA